MHPSHVHGSISACIAACIAVRSPNHSAHRGRSTVANGVNPLSIRSRSSQKLRAHRRLSRTRTDLTINRMLLVGSSTYKVAVVTCGLCVLHCVRGCGDGGLHICTRTTKYSSPEPTNTHCPSCMCAPPPRRMHDAPPTSDIHPTTRLLSFNIRESSGARYVSTR